MATRRKHSPNAKNPCLRRREQGFTLLEIILVLLLLGFLIAVAFPMFRDTDFGANQAEVDALAEALTAVSARNYALSVSGSGDAFAVTNCTDVPNGLPYGHGVPVGYTISSIAVTTHARVTCTVSNGSESANFIAVGT